jgi:flagellar basal body-associated protein FliL
MTKKTKMALIIAIVLFIVGMAFYPFLKRYFNPKEKEDNTVKKEVPIVRKALNVNTQIVK